MGKYIMALDQGTTSSRCILFDKKGKVFPYLITVIVLSIAFPAFLILKGIKNILWDISLMTGLVSLAGLIIFRGSKLVNELHKRFHM